MLNRCYFLKTGFYEGIKLVQYSTTPLPTPIPLINYPPLAKRITDLFKTSRFPMSRKGLLLVSLLFLVACVGCAKSDSEKALDAAHQWVDSSTDSVVDEVVKLVIGEIPIVGRLARNVIANEINIKITWSYSEPVKRSGSVYGVKATASVEPEFNVPLLGTKKYRVSLPFDPQVDVSNGEITRWSPSLTSASVVEQP